MLLVVAPITWFSDRWRTPVVNWWRRINHAQLTALPVLNEPNNDLERFRACLPQVELCQKLVGQYASPLGGLNLGIMRLEISEIAVVEVRHELPQRGG